MLSNSQNPYKKGAFLNVSFSDYLKRSQYIYKVVGEKRGEALPHGQKKGRNGPEREEKMGGKYFRLKTWMDGRMKKP